MSHLDVVDPQVKVDLLRWTPVRPVGPHVPGRELASYLGSPSTSTMCHSILSVDRAAEHSGPEAVPSRRTGLT